MMAMAGERLAFLREIFLRRVAESDDKRKGAAPGLFPILRLIIEDTLYILSVSIKTCGINLSLRSSSPG